MLTRTGHKLVSLMAALLPLALIEAHPFGQMSPMAHFDPFGVAQQYGAHNQLGRPILQLPNNHLFSMAHESSLMRPVHAISQPLYQQQQQLRSNPLMMIRPQMQVGPQSARRPAFARPYYNVAAPSPPLVNTQSQPATQSVNHPAPLPQQQSQHQPQHQQISSNQQTIPQKQQTINEKDFLSSLQIIDTNGRVRDLKEFGLVGNGDSGEPEFEKHLRDIFETINKDLANADFLPLDVGGANQKIKNMVDQHQDNLQQQHQQQHPIQQNGVPSQQFGYSFEQPQQHQYQYLKPLRAQQQVQQQEEHPQQHQHVEEDLPKPKPLSQTILEERPVEIEQLQQQQQHTDFEEPPQQTKQNVRPTFEFNGEPNPPSKAAYGLVTPPSSRAPTNSPTLTPVRRNISQVAVPVSTSTPIQQQQVATNDGFDDEPVAPLKSMEHAEPIQQQQVQVPKQAPKAPPRAPLFRVDANRTPPARPETPLEEQPRPIVQQQVQQQVQLAQQQEELPIKSTKQAKQPDSWVPIVQPPSLGDQDQQVKIEQQQQLKDEQDGFKASTEQVAPPLTPSKFQQLQPARLAPSIESGPVMQQQQQQQIDEEDIKSPSRANKLRKSINRQNDGSKSSKSPTSNSAAYQVIVANHQQKDTSPANSQTGDQGTKFNGAIATSPRSSVQVEQVKFNSFEQVPTGEQNAQVNQEEPLSIQTEELPSPPTTISSAVTSTTSTSTTTKPAVKGKRVKVQLPEKYKTPVQKVRDHQVKTAKQQQQQQQQQATKNLERPKPLNFVQQQQQQAVSVEQSSVQPPVLVSKVVDQPRPPTKVSPQKLVQPNVHLEAVSQQAKTVQEQITQQQVHEKKQQVEPVPAPRLIQINAPLQTQEQQQQQLNEQQEQQQTPVVAISQLNEGPIEQQQQQDIFSQLVVQQIDENSKTANTESAIDQQQPVFDHQMQQQKEETPQLVQDAIVSQHNVQEQTPIVEQQETLPMIVDTVQTQQQVTDVSLEQNPQQQEVVPAQPQQFVDTSQQQVQQSQIDQQQQQQQQINTEGQIQDSQVQLNEQQQQQQQREDTQVQDKQVAVETPQVQEVSSEEPPPTITTTRPPPTRVVPTRPSVATKEVSDQSVDVRPDTQVTNLASYGPPRANQARVRLQKNSLKGRQYAFDRTLNRAIPIRQRFSSDQTYSGAPENDYGENSQTQLSSANSRANSSPMTVTQLFNTYNPLQFEPERLSSANRNTQTSSLYYSSSQAEDASN